MSELVTESAFELDRTALLQRAPELILRVGSDGSTVIAVDDRTVAFGAHTLLVLDVFSKPTTFQHALEALEGRVHGAQEWIDLTTNILNLHEAGALVEADSTPVVKANRLGFASAAIHIRMLDDRARTESYLAAIGEVVKPGDVVIDLGTGTGVLAVAAAKAGAERVYAIEASSIGTVASSVFEANGLADRITLVRGWSTQVDLPERADVLVSEIIGNEPLSERVLEATADAMKRHLKPDARFVPQAVRIYGIPVEIPSEVLARHRFSAASLHRWRDWYGIDFGPLDSAARHPAPYVFVVRPDKAREWVRLAEPCLLAEIDLRTATPRLESAAAVTTHTPGRVDGVIMYFELGLSPGVELSLHPDAADHTCSWQAPVWLLPEPLEVEESERLSMTYSYRGSRVRSRVEVTRATF